MPILIYGGKQDTLDWEACHPHAMLRGALGFFDIVGAKTTRVKMILVNEGGHFLYVSIRNYSTPIRSRSSSSGRTTP